MQLTSSYQSLSMGFLMIRIARTALAIMIDINGTPITFILEICTNYVYIYIYVCKIYIKNTKYKIII